MGYKQIVRRHWVLAHRLLGLALVLVLALSCVTGLLLVFKDSLDRWINQEMMLLPEQHPPHSSTVSLSLEQIEARLLQRYPDSRVSWFDLRGETDLAAVYWLSGQTDPMTGRYRAPEHNQVFIDLSTGEILGGRQWGDIREPWVNLMPLIYQLHYSLLAGGVGANLLGIACVFWLLQTGLGFYLTWPKGSTLGFVACGKKWLGYWRFRKGRSEFQTRYFRHRWLGLWLSPMMLVFALSGLAFNLKPVYFGLLDLCFERQTQHLNITASSSGQTHPMPIDQALQQGQRLMAELAGQTPFQVMHPVGLSYSAYNGHYLYRVYSNLDTSAAYARTSIWFDGHSGALVATFLPTSIKPVDSFTSWISALHMAKAGLWSQALVLVSTCALILLLTSGLSVMLLKIKAQQSLSVNKLKY